MKKDKKTQLIISQLQNQDTFQATTQARSQLYQLIAQFRKEARTAEEKEMQELFEFAADIIAELAGVFRHEEEALRHRRQLDQCDENKP
ncbi:hypothetical protein MASR2M15_03670 [Anaerolineales bacterium]